MDLLLYWMTWNRCVNMLTWINFDGGDHLEVAVAGDLCGWAVAPYRSLHGSPATQLFSHTDICTNIVLTAMDNKRRLSLFTDHLFDGVL